ncbi:MAG: prolipoprotein diacylglyceryl transferase [Deinococcota bacterium]
MDPIMISLGRLAIRWYGFLIALGVLFGTLWATHEAKKRDLDENKLLDMVVYLVIAGLIGARLVYVLTSPSRFFGQGGNPIAAFYVWEGGISIHGGILGIILATWIYSRIHNLNMWAYLDVMTPAGCLGIIGGRLGNFMNGSDTTGRLTGWPIGFTWPAPGTETFGTFGRVIFGQNLWRSYPGTCSLGSDVSLTSCLAQGGEILRGPVHLAQFYGLLVGLILTFIILWAFRRSQTPGFVFWQFILWYSVLRSVIEEPFRDNPLFWRIYLAEGVDAPGIGLLTLTQIASIVIILVACYILLVMNPDEAPKRERLTSRARGR